ncbi:unnamed protein product [Paramecium pentaurelia]|uniref:Uncharacterized protein n=1 Tax=Paramecium pentaurelia TaxID=43138 RepID=A0A8S1YP79_9CILI|nr:unnamed protein product [Paramecium pentaurelia]
MCFEIYIQFTKPRCGYLDEGFSKTLQMASKSRYEKF